MKILLVCNIVLALFFLLSLLSPGLDPEIMPVLSSFGIVYLILFFFNLTFFLFWLLAKKKYIYPSALVLLLAIPSFPKHFQVKLAENTTRHDLKIMSYNLSGMHDYNLSQESGQKALRDMIEDLIKSEPDFICLQETNNYILESLERLPGYTLSSNHKYGPAILSKYPISNSGYKEYPSLVNAYCWIDAVLSDNTVISVYSVHLSSSNISTEADQLISGGISSNEEAVHSSFSIYKKYLDQSQQRAREAKELHEVFKTQKNLFIVGSDLNETAQSYTYSMVKAGQKDSFRKRGSYFGTSYLGRIPFLRIDYIFIPPEWTILEHSIKPWKYSDHAAIETKLKF